MDRDSLQLKELQDALIDAFPKRSDLERMVLYGLNQDLSAIARDGNLQNESHVPRSVTIEGTASNTLNGKELWILVAAEGMQDYFPQPGPVQVVKDGMWSLPITVGIDTDHDKKFVLYTALFDIAGKSAIDKYFMQTPSPDYIGINSLEGIQLMSKINVIRI